MVKSCNGNSLSFPQLYSHFPYFYSNSHPHDIITVTVIPMGPMGSQLFPFPFTSLIWSCITPAVSGKHCMHSRFTQVWFPRLGRAVCLYSFFLSILRTRYICCILVAFVAAGVGLVVYMRLTIYIQRRPSVTQCVGCWWRLDDIAFLTMLGDPGIPVEILPRTFPSRTISLPFLHGIGHFAVPPLPSADQHYKLICR